MALLLLYKKKTQQSPVTKSIWGIPVECLIFLPESFFVGGGGSNFLFVEYFDVAYPLMTQFLSGKNLLDLFQNLFSNANLAPGIWRR